MLCGDKETGGEEVHSANFKWQGSNRIDEGVISPGSGDNVMPWKTEEVERGMSPGMGV